MIHVAASSWSQAIVNYTTGTRRVIVRLGDLLPGIGPKTFDRAGWDQP